MCEKLNETFAVSKESRSPDFKRMFRDARRTLVEKSGRDSRGPVKNWDETWTEYVKRIRYEVRQALLDEHVPERKCGKCGETKTKSRQWVVLRGDELRFFDGLGCVCRSCYRRGYVNLNRDVGGRPRTK